MDNDLRHHICAMGFSISDVRDIKHWFCLSLAELIASDEAETSFATLDIPLPRDIYVMRLLRWCDDPTDISPAILAWMKMVIAGHDDNRVLMDLVALLDLFTMLTLHPPQTHTRGEWTLEVSTIIEKLKIGLHPDDGSDRPLSAHQKMELESAASWLTTALPHLWN